jgi:hypothetical protein
MKSIKYYLKKEGLREYNGGGELVQSAFMHLLNFHSANLLY